MKLKEWINKNDVSVSKLSEVTGIADSTLRSYVNETHEVSLKNALKIEEATLGAVTLKDLLREEGR